MMTGELRGLVERAHYKNEEAMLKIIHIFKPLIKKLSAEPDSRVEESDLSLQLIYTMGVFNTEKLSRFESDGQIFTYIERGIRRKYIQLSKKQRRVRDCELLLDEADIDRQAFQPDNFWERVYIEDMLGCLTELQRYVIRQRFIFGMSDIEIAESMGVTRQYVNRIKNKALERLKKYI